MMGDLLRDSFGYIATIIGALTAGTVAILRERYKSTQLRIEAGRDDTTAEEVAIQAARVDERTQCEKQIAALREDLAELRGRIDEQSATSSKWGGAPSAPSGVPSSPKGERWP
jgi:alpha-galactosidase/6-phospho-beta-glucosidase family protein